MTGVTVTDLKVQRRAVELEPQLELQGLVARAQVLEPEPGRQGPRQAQLQQPLEQHCPEGRFCAW